MTAQILEFKKPGGIKPHHRVSDVKIKTNRDIFQEVHEDILGDWQRFAVKNRLSDFIASKLPSFIRGPLVTDYVNDLNAIAAVEQKLEMKVAVFYPGCTSTNEYGWLVAFHYGKEIFSSSPDMVSEANARALNILLYLSFCAQMKSLGREVI